MISVLFRIFFAEILDYSDIISCNWKITNDTSVKLENKIPDISNWHDINLVLTWYRQCYFYSSLELIIVQNFKSHNLKNDYSSSPFVLRINLHVCKMSLFKRYNNSREFILQER